MPNPVPGDLTSCRVQCKPVCNSQVFLKILISWIMCWAELCRKVDLQEQDWAPVMKDTDKVIGLTSSTIQNHNLEWCKCLFSTKFSPEVWLLHCHMAVWINVSRNDPFSRVPCSTKPPHLYNCDWGDWSVFTVAHVPEEHFGWLSAGSLLQCLQLDALCIHCVLVLCWWGKEMLHFW